MCVHQGVKLSLRRGVLTCGMPLEVDEGLAFPLMLGEASQSRELDAVWAVDIYIYIYICICISICIYVYVCVYIYIYIHM